MKKLTSREELTRRPAQNRRAPRLLWGALVLALVVVACLAAFLPGKKAVSPAPTAAPDETVLLLDKTRADFGSVTVTPRGEAPYTLKVSDGLFVLEGREESFPLDQDAATLLCANTLRLTAAALVEANASDLAAYGLADPDATLHISFADGSHADLSLGGQAPVGSGWYAQMGKNVYLLFASTHEALARPLRELHATQLPITFACAPLIQRLKIEQNGQTLALRYLDENESGYSVSRLRLEQPFRYDAQGQRAIDLLSAVAALRPTAYAGERDELPLCGLDNPAVRVTATGADGRALCFAFGARDEATGDTYASIDDTDAVYRFDTDALSFLSTATAGNLVDPFVHLVSLDKIVSVSLETENETYTLQPDGFTLNGRAMAEADFRSLYQALAGVSACGLSNGEPQGAKIAAVRFALKDAPGELTAEYLAVDADTCAVRRDGVTLLLVRRDALDGLLATFRQALAEN